MFPTNGDTWLNVCRYDPYFNGIRLVDTPEDFIEMADTWEFTKRRLYGRNTK